MDAYIRVGIGVLILQNGRLLLGHRVRNAADTGGIYEPDSWCLPGGKQEYGETILEGAVRETKEETNLDINDLQVYSAVDDLQPGKHYVTIQVIARACSGTLCVMEPEKQDEWKWFPVDQLPKEHIHAFKNSLMLILGHRNKTIYKRFAGRPYETI